MLEARAGPPPRQTPSEASPQTDEDLSKRGVGASPSHPQAGEGRPFRRTGGKGIEGLGGIQWIVESIGAASPTGSEKLDSVVTMSLFVDV